MKIAGMNEEELKECLDDDSFYDINEFIGRLVVSVACGGIRIDMSELRGCSPDRSLHWPIVHDILYLPNYGGDDSWEKEFGALADWCIERFNIHTSC